MLTVNKKRFEQQDFAAMHAYLRQFEEFSRPEGLIYAVCLKDAFDLIALVIYLQENSGSILLIHADTPLQTAKELAVQANSHFFIYGTVDCVVKISQNRPFHRPSLMQYSSGTTGRPKLIAREWQDVECEIEHYNRSMLASRDERAVILVPVSHSYGLITGVLASMRRGSEPIVVQDPNPKAALQWIRTVPQSIVYAVPFQYHLLNALGRDELVYHKLVSSGAPMTSDLLSHLQRRSSEVWQQYGCTETGCVSIGKLDSVCTEVGRALGHLQVELAPSLSHPGLKEIVVRVGGRRIDTHDAGAIRELGTLHVLGRIDDVINVSGLKVFPVELEDTIARMQGVQEVVVHKTVHKVWGEAVKARVVVSGDIGAEDIRGWCIDRLPAYKVPYAIEIVKEIPKLPTGKVSRSLLFEQERIS